MAWCVKAGVAGRGMFRGVRRGVAGRVRLVTGGRVSFRQARRGRQVVVWRGTARTGRHGAFLWGESWHGKAGVERRVSDRRVQARQARLGREWTGTLRRVAVRQAGLGWIRRDVAWQAR